MPRAALSLVFAAALLSVATAAEPDMVEVRPQRINDVLTNPNMGFADFHMGFHCERAGMTAKQCADIRGHQWPQNYPKTAVAYFRPRGSLRAYIQRRGPCSIILG